MREQLRGLLRQAHPWVQDTDIGPAAVDAGECDRCGLEARMVVVCGPGAWISLGRQCARELGAEAWCEGHRDEAERALRGLLGLPAEADAIARLWWVATGEVRVDPELAAQWRRAALPKGP